MRILTAGDVRALFTMRDAFAAVEEAAVAHVQQRTDTPPRHQLDTATPPAEMLVMPGTVDATRFGVKLWYRFEDIGGAPASSACILLLDPDTGEEVLLDGELITDLRTGALTGVAARRLAPADATDIGIVGAGIQARTQILALLEALPATRRVRVFARNTERLTAFVARMRAELDRPDLVEAAASAEAACAGADVLVAATTSSGTVIEDAWVKDGALVCGVGSHDPGSHELDPRTLARAELVVVDTLRGGVDGAGDIAGPIAQGAVDRADVLELGEVVDGSRDWRRTAAGVAVFKSVGFATVDIVAASRVAALAVRRAAGTEIDLHDTGGQ